MTTDALATPWGQAPLLDVDVLAVLPQQRTAPAQPCGPWGDRPLPVPVAAWWLRQQREGRQA